jgi:uncharacterized membrane protein YgcG
MRVSNVVSFFVASAALSSAFSIPVSSDNEVAAVSRREVEVLEAAVSVPEKRDPDLFKRKGGGGGGGKSGGGSSGGSSGSKSGGSSGSGSSSSSSGGKGVGAAS